MALLPFLVGCGSLPAFKIAIDSDPPGARIEVNGEYIGVAPTTYTIRGNDDRSFNGSWVGTTLFSPRLRYTIKLIFTSRKNRSAQVHFSNRATISPERMLFDMHVKSDTSRDNC